jgi:predicted amidophosphoribosyltransferase
LAKFCPSCGKPADDNKKFCADCGAALGSAAAGTPPQETYAGNYTPAELFCVNCGKPFDKDWKFCYWCGAAAANQNADVFSRAEAASAVTGLSCSFCGAPLGGGGKFCAKCGAPATTGGRSGRNINLNRQNQAPTTASGYRAANWQGGYQQQPAYTQQTAYPQQTVYQQPAYQQGHHAQYAQPYYPVKPKKKSGFLVPNILLICACAAMIALLAIYAPKNIDVAKREEQSFETFPITDELKKAYDRIAMELMMNPPTFVEVDPITGE